VEKFPVGGGGGGGGKTVRSWIHRDEITKTSFLAGRKGGTK